jgi:ABC-2 type transport system ATP-binding protein
MPLLQLKNINKNFVSQKALDDVNISIEQGSIFGLLGPNGAGKTTLLRIITGIFFPDSGDVLLDGRKFDGIKDVSLIGYMPEERGLYKKMKIGEQALYLARLKGLSYGEAMEKVKYWFLKLGMESWWNKKVEDLSKGMSQKLQFVTTVVHSPKLIILDEPFSGLDPVNANLIKDEIFDLAKKGSTIIFSTHRMEQVEEICDQIVLMNKGKTILDGTVASVKQQFKENIFNIKFEGDNINTLSNAFSIESSDEEGYKVKINGGYKPNDVLSHFIQQQAGVQSFNEILPSLNEIFIKVVDTTPTARKFEQTPS